MASRGHQHSRLRMHHWPPEVWPALVSLKCGTGQGDGVINLSKMELPSKGRRGDATSQLTEGGVYIPPRSNANPDPTRRKRYCEFNGFLHVHDSPEPMHMPTVPHESRPHDLRLHYLSRSWFERICQPVVLKQDASRSRLKVRPARVAVVRPARTLKLDREKVSCARLCLVMA